MWSVRKGITASEAAGAASRDTSLDQDLLCSQRKWRDDKLGSNTKLMGLSSVTASAFWGMHSLLNLEQNHGCPVEVQA